MHRNIGTFHSRWNSWNNMKTLLYNKHSFPLFFFFFFISLCFLGDLLSGQKLVDNRRNIFIYILLCNNNREKYIELNDPNWNVCVCPSFTNVPLRFALFYGSDSPISQPFVIARTIYYCYYHCFAPFDIVFKRSERKTQHSKRKKRIFMDFVLF